MHVRRLILTHVRQFDHQVFDFQPGFNLLVGRNGAGKTTVLRSIHTVLGNTKQTKRPTAIVDEDISLRTSGLEIEADVYNGQTGVPKTLFYQKDFSKSPRRSKKEDDILVILYASNEAVCSSFVSRQIRRFSSSRFEDIRSSERFLFEAERMMDVNIKAGERFGSSRDVRAFVEDVLLKFSKRFSRFNWIFEPYDFLVRPPFKELRGAGTRSAVKRRVANIVLRRLQEGRFERGRPHVWPDQQSVILNYKGEIVGAERSEPVLPELMYWLREANAEKEIGASFEECTFEVRLTPRIVVHGDSGPLTLSQLSDGEQRLFSLFVEIARQLHLNSGRGQSRRSEAVVLIDEIDVHLHPKWQRGIVPALEDLFPACQFIATTHSPFVIQAVDRSKIIRLEDDEEVPLDESANSIEDIAEGIQGVNMPQRSLRAEELNNAAILYFSLLQQGREVNKQALASAEVRYRKASEPFTSEPALHALLTIEKLEAENR